MKVYRSVLIGSFLILFLGTSVITLTYLFIPNTVIKLGSIFQTAVPTFGLISLLYLRPKLEMRMYKNILIGLTILSILAVILKVISIYVFLPLLLAFIGLSISLGPKWSRVITVN